MLNVAKVGVEFPSVESLCGEAEVVASTGSLVFVLFSTSVGIVQLNEIRNVVRQRENIH